MGIPDDALAVPRLVAVLWRRHRLGRFLLQGGDCSGFTKWHSPASCVLRSYTEFRLLQAEKEKWESIGPIEADSALVPYKEDPKAMRTCNKDTGAARRAEVVWRTIVT